MAGYRKLGRTSSQRKALLRNQVTNLLYHGKIVTTEAKAKEIRKIAEKLIAMAVKEKDNYETVTVKAKVAHFVFFIPTLYFCSIFLLRHIRLCIFRQNATTYHIHLFCKGTVFPCHSTVRITFHQCHALFFCQRHLFTVR